ncbi:MAG: hypothetical protein QOF83_2759 [Solirubrobacteraceae bacterium]|jgi:hypothetical protein|nr:hypothetical protein [Solirubrobacteraceae bacterium]
MGTSAPQGGRPNGASTGPTPLTSMAHGQELYEQLLELADKVGAAYAEAVEQIGGAYMEAFSKLAPAGAPQNHDWRSALPSGATQDPLADAQEYALAIGEHLGEMSLEVGLAYLDAVQRVTLAAAQCHEQLGALSQLDLVKSTAKTRADLARTVAEASTTALRDIVD